MLTTNKISLKYLLKLLHFLKELKTDNKFTLAYVHSNDAKQLKRNSARVHLRMNGASTQYYPTMKTIEGECLLRRGWTCIGLIPKPLCGQARRPWSRASPPHPPSRLMEEVRSLGRRQGQSPLLAACPDSSHSQAGVIRETQPTQPAPVRALACPPTPGPSLKPGATGRGGKTSQADSQKQTLAPLWGLVPERRPEMQEASRGGEGAAGSKDARPGAQRRLSDLLPLSGSPWKPRKVKWDAHSWNVSGCPSSPPCRSSQGGLNYNR